MESIDLQISDLEPLNLDIVDDFPMTSGEGGGSGGGMGMEFLMNKKVSVSKSGSNNNISLGDVSNMESDLNDLAGLGAPKAANSGDSKVLSGISNLFGFGGSDKGVAQAQAPASSIGKATKEETSGTSSTWDGFMKFNDIPDAKPVQTRMTEREKLRKKKMMISRLNEWKEKGIISGQVHFSQDMSYEEIEDEYETALEDKKKKEAKKLYSWWFLTAVNTLEYANSALNPFDINLDGWGESVSDDMDSYDEIFGKLYEKYKGGEMSPELSLVMRLGFSAAMTSFTNKALSSATPGFNDVIRQSPELMKAFTSATASAMSQQSPGFAFANNLVNPEPKGPPPPAPVDPRQGMRGSNRPDLDMSRGLFRQEPGIDIKNNQESTVKMDRSPVNPPSFTQRPEMAGPRNTNIDGILSGLKTKTVDLNQRRDDDSIMSVSSIKDLNEPRSGRSRKGSNKNVISLDL